MRVTHLIDSDHEAWGPECGPLISETPDAQGCVNYTDEPSDSDCQACKDAEAEDYASRYEPASPWTVWQGEAERAAREDAENHERV